MDANTTNTNNIYTLDFGGRQKIAWLSCNGQPAKSITYKEVFDLPNTLPQKSVLISEYAHLGCPKESSLAQPFSSKELLQLYKNCEENNITLRLFPHAMTPAALGNYRLRHPEVQKSDEIDPIVIYEYVINSKISLQKPPKYFETKHDVLYRQITNTPKNIVEEYWIRKNELNTILNIARKDNYDCDGSRNDKISQFIMNNIDDIYKELLGIFPKETIDNIFDFKLNKKTNKVLVKTSSKKPEDIKWKFKIGLIYTILATLLDAEGNLLLRKNNRFPSVYHIMRYVLCMTPNHFRGGIARSNICWHGFKNHLRKVAKEDPRFLIPNTEKKKKNKEFISSFERKVNNGQGVKVIVGHGNFTEEEKEFFLKHRREYMNVLKKLNYILRKKLKPEIYNNEGHIIH